MKSISPLAMQASIWAGVFALTGCGASQSQFSSLGLMPGQGHRAIASPAKKTKQFGVGLADEAGADGDTASSPFTYQYCNGVLENPSGCYGEVPGKRKFTSSASGSVNLVTGSDQPNGYAKVKLSATSKLGTGSYSLVAETNELTKGLRNIGAAAQVVSSGWDDTFSISSGSLKKGTPVMIGVELALTQVSTTVGCDSAQNSFGELNFYSPSVTPPSGSQFSITGYCVNGSFEYYLYNNTKQTGTTATGTVTTAVGDTFTLYFVATGQVIACQTVNYCAGDIISRLSGNYKLTVTSITAGATYTTASGNMYQ